MSDRELLELAAKAAGHRIVEWAQDGNGVDVAIIFGGEGWGRERPWQPLLENQMTDAGGDALRLAVKLRIDVNHGGTLVVAEQVKPHDTGCAEPRGADPYAATRRAITRVAAEIGRSMS